MWASPKLTFKQLNTPAADLRNRRLVWELYQKYHDKVYKTCFDFCKDRWNAQDLCQEVFMRLIHKLDPESSNPYRCLRAITYQVCCEAKDSPKKDILQQTECLDSNLDMEEAESSRKNRERNFLKMRNVIRHLDPELKIILEKRYIEKLTIAQLGKELWIGKDKIHLQLAQAKKQALELWLALEDSYTLDGIETMF